MTASGLRGGPLATRIRTRPTKAAYAALLSLVVLAACGAVGLALHEPWLFPSLGPTAMLFFQSPGEPASRPLDALVGHGVGLVVGYGCYLAFGLQGRPSVPAGGLTPAYLLGGALSVAITTAVLALLALPHPPAGATTLIVSLGILATPSAVLSMAGAIVLITLLGWAADRLLLGRPDPR